MALPFQNVYTHRKVAEVSSKPCMVCFKPSTSVLITSCQKDFFYICANHLTDRGFATAIIDEAAEAEKKKKEEMDRELEKVKKEYEEKLKRKEEKKKEKDGKDGKDKAVDKDKDADKGKGKDAQTDRIKVEAEDAGKSEHSAETATSKEYQLHRDFFNMRLQKYREKQIAKRNLERLKSPSSFPAVPKGGPA